MGIEFCEKDPPTVGTVNVVEVVPVALITCAGPAVKTTLREPSICTFTRRLPDAECCPKRSVEGEVAASKIRIARVKM
jgi:hypothetical protein